MATNAPISITANPTNSLNDPRLLSEWFAVAWSSEVAPGATLARKILQKDLVLWRSHATDPGSADGLHCWLDLCIHRGAKLSLGVIRNSCLVCPYHGWSYAESGQCISIPAHPNLTPPAKAHATTFQVQERYGVVWLCLGTPTSDLPQFKIADEPGFRILLAGPYRFRALGPRLIENLLDVAHLGIVHAGLLGEPERSEIEDYEVTMGPRGPEAKQIRIWQPNPDGTGEGAHVTYHYAVQGPLTAGFLKLTQRTADEYEADHRLAFLAQVAPVDSEFSEMRMLIALNYGDAVDDQELIAFQDYVVEQDRAVVESQRPEFLPLDLQAELHLRSDRMAIAYRKWLREIGFTYGVA